MTTRLFKLAAKVWILRTCYYEIEKLNRHQNEQNYQIYNLFHGRSKLFNDVQSVWISEWGESAPTFWSHAKGDKITVVGHPLMSPGFGYRKHYNEALGMKRKYTDLRLDSEPSRMNQYGLSSLNLANQIQNGGPMPEVLMF